MKQDTIALILDGMGGLLHKEIRKVRSEDLKFLLTMFNYFKVDREFEVNTVVNLIGRLQHITVNEEGNYEKKEWIIIRTICSILAEDREKSGNLGVLFDEYLVGSSEDASIQKFCDYRSDFLFELSP